TGALLVGSGGRALFARFRASPESADGAADPLDRYTRRTVVAALAGVLTSEAGAAGRAFFPFVGSAPVLPFQRLGRAAGLAVPGPLGLQIHPVFGPWWSYRALLALRQ